MGRESDKETANNYNHLSDAELVAGCLEGDSQAWEAVILRYQRLIYSIPLRMGLHPSDAADVFQFVCLKLFEKLSSLRNREKLASWIITATTRECWRVHALARRETGPGIDALAETPEDLPELAPGVLLPYEQQVMIEQQQAVRQAVAGLPERCRELIDLLFYRKDELRYSEISRRLGMPVSSIGPTRARCLEKLKKLLDGKL